ncbi:hypothetical protein PRUB_a3481 [Pseudoalteromonas rubra]|uniref:Phage tail protein I n=1 Tax=Pseudoalteromonas rubra TaxID=43658 RepID=A0A8T0C353_9GAMM|nr:hypothetical protein PRUB_a3481 [Pseudoalteromonas rubra]
MDSWDSLWPEQVQRQVIADSVPNHRIKGTVGAIKQSLHSLNASVELTEWWQTGGVPHSAELLALAHENLDPQGSTLLTRPLPIVKCCCGNALMSRLKLYYWPKPAAVSWIIWGHVLVLNVP